MSFVVGAEAVGGLNLVWECFPLKIEFDGTAALRLKADDVFVDEEG